MLDIKNEIYKEAAEFLNYFKEDNLKVLSNKYDISIELFNEMNEIVLEDCTSNKSELNLPRYRILKIPIKICVLSNLLMRKNYMLSNLIFFLKISLPI